MNRSIRRVYCLVICAAVFCLLVTFLEQRETLVSSDTANPSRLPTFLPVSLHYLPSSDAWINSTQRQRLNAGLERKCAPGHKCIALGTKFFGRWEMWLKYYRFWTSQFKACKYKKCALISDVLGADAVLFHSYDLFPSLRLPRVRQNRKQRWIYFSWESPVNVKNNGYDVFGDHRWRYLFNWTATYKRNSDIITSYGAAVKRSREIPAEQTKLHLDWGPSSSPYTRSRLVFALVSNCNTSTGRLRFLKKLQTVVDLEIYGTCGQRFPYKNIETAAKEFYFYIAFENSRCDDYLTEKFWRNALGSGVVPVVIGGRRQDYEKLAPPDSYIFAEDFDSITDLATYLQSVASNPIKYAKYFEWQRTHELRQVDKAEDFFCSMCEKLFTDDAVTVVDLFSRWNTSDCHVIPFA